MGNKLCRLKSSNVEPEQLLSNFTNKKGYTISDQVHSLNSIANKVTKFKHHKSQEKKQLPRALTVNISNNKNMQEKSLKSSNSKEFKTPEDNKAFNFIKSKFCQTEIVGRLDSLGNMDNDYYKGNIVPLDFKKFKLEKNGDFSANYEIISSLGKGAYGEVSKVRSQVSGKFYAMKTIPKKMCLEAMKVLPEIEILKSLDHPNILRLYEYFQDTQNYYLITEFCKGGELLNYIINMSHFSERDSAKIMSQVLSAVCYCHNNNVIHRDLKPENLVLEEEDIQSNIKIIDFGTSKIINPDEKLKELTGTAYYIAPEVISNNYDQKCDVWSCGVILYVLLSGTIPFSGSTNEEILKKVTIGTVKYNHPAWNHISKDAISLVKKMLMTNPLERISAEEALNDIWIIKFTHKFDIDLANLSISLQNLKLFKANINFQRAALAFIAKRFTSHEEEIKLRETFKMIDTNGDGQLSREELIEGFKQLLKDEELAIKRVDQIMKNIDINQNGNIDYNEFLMANINLHVLESEEHLKEAFNFFDEDKNGSISIKEIQKMLGESEDSKTIQKLLFETDLNNDGEISYEEFKNVIDKFILSNSVSH